MKVDNNRFVSLLYELRENDGEGRIIEELDSSRPLSFIFGSGGLIAGFEDGIRLLTADDQFSFAVSATEGYGERREDMVINIPLNVFEKDGKVDENICFVGNSIPMSDSQGRRIDGVVLEIGDNFVVMDFNHPLAGSNLHFSGKIVEVREATDDELAAVTRTGGGCSGCSGSSSDCGSHC